jgi:hypothetical protein
MLGDWDGAEAELTWAADSDALADIDLLACYRAWLAALRATPPLPRPCWPHWGTCAPAKIHRKSR